MDTLDFSGGGTPVQDKPDFSSGGTVVQDKPDFSSGGIAVSMHGAVPDWAKDTTSTGSADQKPQTASKQPASIADLPKSLGDFTPIGDAAPDFGEGKIQPGEMESAGKEFRRVGSIAGQAAASRALNLGAMLHQGMNPGETIAARLTGVPDEATQVGQMRNTAKSIAPNVAADDRGGRFAEMIGGLAPDLVAATATGGIAELPAGASLGLRALHGAATMALPAAENTREAYNRATESGLTPAQAAGQAGVAGIGTLAMGAIPANIPGDLATRALSGAAIAGLQTEGQRRVANALLPEDRQDLQQPFDQFNLGAGMLTGGVLAGVLGHGAHADSSSAPKSTDFVADANGGLREVPKQSEQPASDSKVKQGGFESYPPQAVPAAAEIAQGKPPGPIASALSKAQPSPLDKLANTLQVPPEQSTPESAAAPSASVPDADVLGMAKQAIDHLTAKQNPTDTDRAMLQFLQYHADNPKLLAEALGIQPSTPDSQRAGAKPNPTGELPVPMPETPTWQKEIEAHPDLSDETREGLLARYQHATETKPVFDHSLSQIATDLGLPDPKLAPIKGTARTIEKTLSEYGGDASRMKDIVRGTLVVNSPEEAAQAVAAVKQRFGNDLAIKDNLSDPSLPARDSSGYRDINITAKIGGHPVEIQINTPEMLAAKEVAHKLYDQQRAIEAKYKGENREATGDELAAVGRLKSEQQKIYQDAWATTLRRPEESQGGTPVDTQSLNRASESSAPLRSTDLSGKGLPPDLSQAVASNLEPTRDTGTSSTSQNVVPAGKDLGNTTIAATSDESIPRSDAQSTEAGSDVMQNRDRSRAASVQQMASIAAAPDPTRLSFSRDPNTGAPMVSAKDAAQAVPESDLGRKDHVTLANGRKIPVRYAVVDAADVQASHNADGTTNPGYADAALKALNNGRVAGLKSAYARGNADAYRVGLHDEAELAGVSSRAIASKKEPVLIRLYDDEHNVGDMGAQSNASHQLGVSPSERAFSDARALPDLENLPVSDSGELSTNPAHPFYRDFLKNLGSNEAADAKAILAHEAIGHYGIDRIIDDRVKGGWDRLTNDVERLRSDPKLGGARIRAAIDDVESRYRGSDGTPADRDTFAKELVAVMAERGIRTGLMDRVVAAVRAFVRKALPNMKFGEQDIHRLLRKSDELIHAGGEEAATRHAQVHAMAFAHGEGGAQRDMYVATRGAEKPKPTLESLPEEVRTALRNIMGEIKKGVAPETAIAHARDASVRNAATMVDRATHGMDELPEATHKGWDKSKAEAAEAISNDPDYARNLAREVASKPRTITDAETMALGAERQRLEDSYKFNDDAILKARKEGDTVAEARALAKKSAIEDDLDANHRATQSGGTELARAMAARNAQHGDYSTARTLTRARVAYDKKLDAATEDRLRQLSEKIEAQDKQIAALQAEKEARANRQKLEANEKVQRLLQKQIDSMEATLAKRLKVCPL